MQKQNYGRMLDEKLAELEKSGEKPKLMLHACCDLSDKLGVKVL